MNESASASTSTATAMTTLPLRGPRVETQDELNGVDDSGVEVDADAESG